MKVTYLGHACFLLETAAGTRILIDPYNEQVGYPIRPVPADVVRAYREAFRRLAEDPAFRSEAERLGFEVVYTSGEQVLRTVEEVLNSPPGVVRIFKSFFRFGD